MHYAIELVTLGENADPHNVVRYAQAAEAAGWEGLFVWDHHAFTFGVPSTDPWVSLAAAAQATQHIKLGTSVTPVPKHLPHALAHTVAVLDVLSQGRVIFGAGLGGVPEEYSAYGLPDDARVRARQLDESLAVMSRLWAGESVSHHGEFYTVNGVTLSPLPVQHPRVPVWIGGASRPAMRRAACWDGWVVPCATQDLRMAETPVEVNEHIRYCLLHRSADTPLDVAITGYSTPRDTQIVREYTAAGVTWWMESLHGYRGNNDELMKRVDAGPPRV